MSDETKTKTYRVYAKVSGTKYLGTVEAATAEEAKAEAWKLDSAYVSLCHQCSLECEDPEVESVQVELDD